MIQPREEIVSNESADIPQEEMEPAVPKIVSQRRKIAIVLSVVVTSVLLFSIVYLLFFQPITGCACIPGTNIALTKSISQDGTNWIVTIGTVQGVAAKSDLTFRVMSNGSAITGTTMVMSYWVNTTALHFSPVSYSATTLIAGDAWMLSRTTFTAGMQVQVLTANQVIGQITL